MVSLERRLLAWVLAALALGSIIVGLVIYAVVLDEMEEIFNENLRQAAMALAGRSPDSRRSRAVPGPPAVAHGYEEAGDFRIVTSVFDMQGRVLATSDADARLPANRSTGLADLTAGGRHWRAYTIVFDDRIVQAAQEAAAYRRLAGSTASELLPPLLLLVPIVGMLLVIALRRGLVPLQRAASDVAARSAASLTPIEFGGAPREIRPLIDAMNDLLTRLSHALDTQRRFVAEAAHELRTPITALSLQLQWLDEAADEADRAEARLELAQGVERAQRLVGQLLDLSRTEPDAPGEPTTSVDLSTVVDACVRRWRTAATEKALCVTADLRTARVQAGPHEVEILVDNIVGNAVRYVHAGGRIWIETAMSADTALLKVADDGPGLTDAERDRAFDRFFRGERAIASEAGVPGSGLGLAIVRAIAERHGATVTLGVGPGEQGLEVVVRFSGNSIQG